MAYPAHQTRPAAVAGHFYPAEADQLRTTVANLLARAGADLDQSVAAPKALIVPHAGYAYSGAVAAQGYARFTPVRNEIRRVVMLGPAHRNYVRGLAAPTVGSFSTPLGKIPVDQTAIQGVDDFPQIECDDAPHAYEHSLEVQLPFLHRVAPRASLAPFAVGDADRMEIVEVLERLWSGPETRIIISSDLSHFLPYATAQKVDMATADLIEQFDDTAIGPEQACGYRGISGLLTLAKRKRMRVERLSIRNSGDTAGSYGQVVGYGAWAFYEDQ